MKNIRGFAAMAAFLLAGALALPAVEFAISPDEAGPNAELFVVEDSGGTGPAVVFVEAEGVEETCLCGIAGEASSNCRSIMVGVPAGAGDAEVAAFLIRLVNGLGVPKAYFAARDNYVESCARAAASMPASVAGLLAITSNGGTNGKYVAIPAHLEPKRIALLVAGFVAARGGAGDIVLNGRMRRSGWQGWTIE